MDGTGRLRDSLVTVVTVLAASLCGMILWRDRANSFGDFSIFHLGSRLVRDGRAADAYDPEGFNRAWAQDPDLLGEPGELAVFISTPPFALAMRPLTYLSVDAAALVWLALGLVAFVVAIRLLGLPWWVNIIGLLSPIGLFNLKIAQTGYFALLWAAILYRLCAQDRYVAAGVVAGLAVLKPTLLLGIALWWILDWRTWHKALLAAAATGTAIVLSTLIAGIDQWRSFLDALGALGALEGEVQFAQPTILEAVTRAFGDDVSGHPLALASYVVIGLLLMRTAIRRWPSQHGVLAGAAIIVSILISPHLLIYDTTMLLVPFAIAVHHGVSTERLQLLVGITFVTAVLTVVWIAPLAPIQEWTSLATLGLIAVSALWSRWLGEPLTPITNEIVRPSLVDGELSQDRAEGTLPEAPEQRAA